MNSFELSPKTRIGLVSLTVSNLAKQIGFYTNILGLQVHWQEETKAGLGCGNDDLLVLNELKGSRKYPSATGLYHQAFLLPDKKTLAKAVARIAQHNYPQAPTDHTISWTTYLEDYDRNTVELYVATPDEGTYVQDDTDFVVKDKDGRIRSGRDPLTWNMLSPYFSESDEPDDPFPVETYTGHVHLYVNDLQETMDFYHGLLGFKRQAIITRWQMGEVNVEGFPVHMIAFNTWKGSKAKPAPEDGTGLDHFTVFVNSGEIDHVLSKIEQSNYPNRKINNAIVLNDPSENQVRLISRG